MSAPLPSVPSAATAEAPSLGDITGASEDMIEENTVKDWVRGQVQAEVARLREQGAKCIIVPVNTMSIYRVRAMSMVSVNVI